MVLGHLSKWLMRSLFVQLILWLMITSPFWKITSYILVVATDCRRWWKVIPTYIFGRHGMPPILYFARAWFGDINGFSHYSLLIGVHKRELKWVSNCSLNGTGIQQGVVWHVYKCAFCGDSIAGLFWILEFVRVIEHEFLYWPQKISELNLINYVEIGLVHDMFPSRHLRAFEDSSWSFGCSQQTQSSFYPQEKSWRLRGKHAYFGSVCSFVLIKTTLLIEISRLNVRKPRYDDNGFSNSLRELPKE